MSWQWSLLFSRSTEISQLVDHHKPWNLQHLSGFLYSTSAFRILSRGADWKTWITTRLENQSCVEKIKENNPVKDNKSIQYTWGYIWILTLGCKPRKAAASPSCCSSFHFSTFTLCLQIIFRSTTRQASSPLPNIWTTKMWRATSSGSRRTPWRLSCPTCVYLPEVRKHTQLAVQI